MVRKRVFAVFGGFLAVMLVFTVLSRAVSGASMAKVETVRIKTGTIDHKVTGSGKVEAGKEVAVYTGQGQRVKEICVQEGQSVEEGELLFTIDLEELEEAASGHAAGNGKNKFAEPGCPECQESGAEEPGNG